MEDALVIFDIGNVLVHLDEAPLKQWLGVHPSTNIDPSARYFDLAQYDRFHDAVRQLTKKECTTRELRDAYRDTVFAQNSGMVALKERLNSTCLTGLLSDSNQDTRDWIEQRWPGTLAVNGNESFSDVLQCTKPSAPLYRVFNNAAKTIVFIDDRLRNLYHAHKKGWHCILYAHDKKDHQGMISQRMYRAHSPEAVQRILEPLGIRI